MIAIEAMRHARQRAASTKVLYFPQLNWMRYGAEKQISPSPAQI